MQGVLPGPVRDSDRLTVWAEVRPNGDSPTAVAHIRPHDVSLPKLQNPEVNLASVKSQDGPFRIAYEAFHYLALPHPQDMTCSVIQSLGDKFNFLAYYSDFRVDNQEAGTPSDGPLGGNVTGIGQIQHGLETYCSAGQFQWQFIQPVYVNSNQMQGSVLCSVRRDFLVAEADIQTALGNQVEVRHLHSRLLNMARTAKNLAAFCWSRCF